MIGQLIMDLWPYIAGLVVIIAGAGWLRRDAKKDAKRETALEAAERYAKTREKTDAADLGLGASDGERIKRLSDFAAKR